MLSPERLPAANLPTPVWMEVDGHRVAVIVVPSFDAPGTADRFRDLVLAAQARGAEALVVDLRVNRGGLLTECVAAASSLGPVAYQLRGSRPVGWTSTLGGLGGRLTAGPLARWAGPEQRLWQGPAAVLVGPRTASCAELFGYFAGQAGSLVLGQPTQGVANSSVQRFDLGAGYSLSVSLTRTFDSRAGQIRPMPRRLEPVWALPASGRPAEFPARAAAARAALQNVR
ncbi:S41 family peptidase [Deinococcus lacus]|uniref:S41 family peptidase n=1 Tax=Deinococcus lacus TaxID=392561 RepID=A0ABW1Y9B8_9DEIO